MSPAARRLAAPVRRALIEDAAARVFARDGYDGARMDDIAAEAGTNKALIYLHHPSKKALYMALLERERDALGMAAVEAFMAKPDASLRERVDAMLDAWFAYVQEHPVVAPLLFRSPGTAADPDIAALLADLHQRQRDADVALFHEARADVPAHLEQPLAETVRSSLTGLAVWWADHPEVPRADLVAVMHRVLDGIAPH